MITTGSFNIQCIHCGLEATVNTLATHGGTRYEVECHFCGNKSTALHTIHGAVDQYERREPHFHTIGMGFFLNQEEGKAFIYRPVTLKNHRDCMEVMHYGYNEMLLRHNFCPECGCDVRPFVSNLQTHYGEVKNEIQQLATVGDAVLESRTNWTEMYRMRKGSLATAWGGYEDTYALDGKYYISPYWTDGENWLELSAEEALKYTAVHVPATGGIHHGQQILQGNTDIEASSVRGHNESGS